MIVVIDQDRHPNGLGIARAAAAAGGPVELVARVPDDTAGDRWLHGLTAAGIGHVATLRGPAGADAAPLDAADLELALRYLGDVSTIVVTDLDDGPSLTVAAAAAGWSGASLIVVVPPGAVVPAPIPDRTFVFEAPASDPDGAFATLVGSLATRLDGGMDPAAAFAEALAAGASWTPVDDEP